MGEVADIFDGTHQTPKYTDSGVKFVSVENIATLETEKYISQEAYEKEYSNKQAEKGDVLMTRIGDIGTARAIEIDESLAYYVTLALLKPKEIDSDFLAWLINSPEVQRNIWRRTLHIAFPKKINLGEINQVEMMVPKPEEQAQIGSFFRILDHLITLHQRKLDMLKKMKHAYLQQMFAENGESMPRLRFADFDGEWEQRKLGELVDTVKSYSLSRDVETSEHTGFRYVHYGDIHKKIADLIKDDSILPIIKAGEYELLQKDDVIVADASEDYIGIAEPSIILENPKDKIVAGLHTIAMRPKEIDSLFLYYLLHTNRFKRFGNKVGTGMKVFGITTNNLYKFIVLMPNIKEQVKIGTFFKQLDDNITLNQTKLDKLKLIKNVYLQKMFI